MTMRWRWFTVAVGMAVGVYGSFVGVSWLRYGKPAGPSADDEDPLLDRFMPTYDVVERHHVRVAAPPAMTFDVAQTMKLSENPVVRAIVKARELILGATPDLRPRPSGLLDEMRSLGWSVLSEIPEREIVMGAVTRPWQANVTFRPVPRDAFRVFSEPDYVKIVWTLRADPDGSGASMFRSETRAVATDAGARDKFRRYWAFLSPGIFLIRQVALAPLKREAEQRAAEARHHPPPVTSGDQAVDKTDRAGWGISPAAGKNSPFPGRERRASTALSPSDATGRKCQS